MISLTPIADSINIITNVLCIFLCILFFLTIPATIFWCIPKVVSWFELNLSQDYLENRAEKKVRDLRKQIRVIELEKEAVGLEKKLGDLEK